MRRHAFLLAVCLFVGLGCFSPSFSGQPEVSCSSNSDCPSPLRCRAATVCVDAALAEPRCGDGFVDDGEECDDGNAVAGDGCRSDCAFERCGNAVIDPAEECDDGNDSESDGCALCKVAVCGDGFVRSGVESCDDGNTLDGDGCDQTCHPTGCGNGVVAGQELCDDNNAASGDGCDANCTPTACGNGIRAGSEECDDGNPLSGDGCDADCTVTRCGNDVVTGGESCDDGNETDGDGCDRNCTITSCGNAVRTGIEQCDDGNDVDGDGCDHDCTVTRCGNGVTTDGEECDDGNNEDADACLSSCRRPFCGDGIIASGGTEECDLGAANRDDGGCTSTCARARCGDGFLRAELEACDDAGTVGGDGCSADCSKVEVCGDGIVDEGEACDDGNLNDFDTCTAGCLRRAFALVERNAPTLPPPPGPSSVAHVAAAPDGALFIAEQNKVFRLDRGASQFELIGGGNFGAQDVDPGDAIGAPLDVEQLLVDARGAPVVVDRFSNTIVRFTGDGRREVLAPLTISGLFVFDPANRLLLLTPAPLLIEGSFPLPLQPSPGNAPLDVRKAIVVDERVILHTPSSVFELVFFPEPAFHELNGPWAGLAIADLQAGDDGDFFILGRTTLGVARAHLFRQPLAAAPVLVFDVELPGLPGPALHLAVRAVPGLMASPSEIVEVNEDGSTDRRQLDRSAKLRVDLRATTCGDVGYIRARSILAPFSGIADDVNFLESSPSFAFVFADGAFASGFRDGPFPAAGPEDGHAGPISCASRVGPTALLLVDPQNHAIRRLDDGALTTLAGRGFLGFAGDGGPAVSARLDSPTAAIAAPLPGGGDAVFISDTGNRRVRRVDPDGLIRTVLGTGAAADSDGGTPSANLPIAAPRSLALDGANVVVAGGTYVMLLTSDDGLSPPDGSGQALTVAPPGALECLNVLTTISPAEVLAIDTCTSRVFQLVSTVAP